MRKNAKSILSKALALTLAVSMIGIPAPAADAAKKPALSTKKVTLKAGKSKKVTVKNVKAKKIKKLTVKTNKKKVATVKKNGKNAFTIKAVKAGSAKVTATVKVGKKNYKLNVKVSVKSADTTTPSASPAASAAPATQAPAASASTVPTATAPATDAPIPTTEPTATPKTFPYTVVENNFDTEEDMKDWYIRFKEDDNKAAGLDTKISVSSESHTGAGAMLASERLKSWNSPTITLTDKVSGDYVIADAVKFTATEE